jgi:agmatine deiminase
VTDARAIVPQVPEIRRCETSDLVLDGGDDVCRGYSAIVTDQIYCENRRVGRAELRERLRDLLRVETLIVIRKEPLDPLGHADGMVRWQDERTVVANDYQVVGEAFRTSIFRSLRRFGLEVVEVPYLKEEGEPGVIPPALGNWVTSSGWVGSWPFRRSNSSRIGPY